MDFASYNIQMDSFKEWCVKNYLDCSYVEDGIFECGGRKFLLLYEKDGAIFDEDFHFIVEDAEKDLLGKVDAVVYRFGTRYYCTNIGSMGSPESGNMKEFRYIGKTSLTKPGFPFLGVHGLYEILNGSRPYSDWITKAKFLETPVLGICERNTLAGTMPFQLECVKEGIKPILGETITISKGSDLFFEGKVYALNSDGWKNVLLINSEINVKNPSQFVSVDRLLELGKGVAFVFDPLSCPFDPVFVRKVIKSFDLCYYKLDSVVYESDKTDKLFLDRTQEYLNNTLGLKPILLSDAYYLDEDDCVVKPDLNQIQGTKFQTSRNQFYKPDDIALSILDELFGGQDFERVVSVAIDSLMELADKTDFKIETGRFKLPEYLLSKEEKALYGDSKTEFNELIVKGWYALKIDQKPNVEDYINRLEEEMDVIKEGGFIDYFLILYDIINWCRDNDILIGLGRGSAAGSLCTYLLGITQIDPLEYGLLFERFLNRGRIKQSLPDIDTDFESLKRDDVKKYMESKYGSDRVCSLGTYTTLQLKASFRDFCKLRNVPLGTVEFLSKIMSDDKFLKVSWEYIFKLATKSEPLYKFVQEHSEMIEEMRLCHASPRASSVHACACLILPQAESIYTSVPIRKTEMDGKEVIVSEWEGPYIETAGYLKEDILGIRQLDKFRMMVDLIRDHYNVRLDLYNLPYDDIGVYDMFSKGLTGDVFQLGSKGLTTYCVQVKPSSLRELCAIVALYRPGPMDNGFHTEYVQVKNGKKEIVYFDGLEDITKETYGLLVYQEQIMLVTTNIAGFTLQEADDIRKGMGKKKMKYLEEKGVKFVEGGVANGYDRKYLEDLWKRMLAFGRYSFNKSHALCYAATAYICGFIKYHYPLPYWITSLEFSSDDTLPRFISEISKSDGISVVEPDINRSGRKFFADFRTKRIFWSISKVKQCGEVAVSSILDERERNGEFFDMKEFLFRVNKSKVNKSVVENLILSGSFDNMYGIKNPTEREGIIEDYRRLSKAVIDESKDFLSLAKRKGLTGNEWWWQMQQKKVSGLAFFNYEGILCDNGYDFRKLLRLDEFATEDIGGTKMVLTAGIVSDFEVKESKKGPYCKFRIEQNYSYSWVTVWSDSFPTWKSELEGCEGKIVIIKARAYYDSFKGENSLQSDSGFSIQIIS